MNFQALLRPPFYRDRQNSDNFLWKNGDYGLNCVVVFFDLMNRYSLKFRGAFFTCLISAAFAWTTGAQTNDYTGLVWALTDAKKALAAAADITPDKYPNCDDATVEKKMMRVYRGDGTGECQDETYTKVLTEKGRRNNRTLTLSFMLPYYTVSVPKLELIKSDGHVVPVDVAANSKESIDESYMQMNIYDPNQKILQVNIPGLEIGDVIHSVTRQTTDRSFVAGQYADETVLEGPSYILHESYEVHAPADRPLVKIALRDEVAGTVKYSKEAGPDGGSGPSLGNYQCAAHVRRAIYASLRNGLATAVCQHHARLADGLKMVLELEQVTSRRHHAGHEANRGYSYCREDRRGGPDQVDFLFCVEENSIYGPDAGKGSARF